MQSDKSIVSSPPRYDLFYHVGLILDFRMIHEAYNLVANHQSQHIKRALIAQLLDIRPNV